MVGAGLNVFAVWNYCIARNRSGMIELNPRLLAFVLGGEQTEIEEAIEYLTRPDEKSRTKESDGRRLVREGEYQYRMVNWAAYDGIKSESDRRDYNRRKQQECRDRKKAARKLLAGEAEYLKAAEAGANGEELAKIVERHLPVSGGDGEAVSEAVAVKQNSGSQVEIAAVTVAEPVKPRIVRAFQ